MRSVGRLARIGVLDGVADQVHENPPQQIGIGSDMGVRILPARQFDAHAAFATVGFQRVEQGGDDRAERERLDLRPDETRLQARQVEQPGDSRVVELIDVVLAAMGDGSHGANAVPTRGRSSPAPDSLN